MMPTTDELQVAVDAAAQALFDQLRLLMGDSTRWHDLPVEVQLGYRAQALPVAEAVLAALPDRAPAARKAGVEAVIARVRAHVCTCGGDIPGQSHESWCAASVVEELI